MLYCVAVETDLGRWNRNEVSVDPSQHQIWEAKNEEELLNQIWEERCEVANDKDQEGTYVCEDCQKEQDDDDDDCESCGGAVNWEHIQPYAEHVEDNSDFEYIEYDPANPDHARCTNYHGNVERPEHEIAVKAHRVEQLGNRLDRIEQNLGDINAQREELDILQNELEEDRDNIRRELQND